MSPRSVRSRRLVLGVLVTAFLVATGLTSVAVPPVYAAGDPCGPAGNKISCENSKPGTPRSVWDINGAGDDSIQGFATDISVNLGQRIDFKIDTAASRYNITIFRTGYYNGDGARQIATVTPSATLPQHQPQCITDVETDLYDCGNWAVSASWTVPSTAVSGVYIALLENPTNGDSSHITFIVRDDSSTSAIVFQTDDPTWQAYNTYGGADFYVGGSHGRSFKVSYNRPVLTRDGTGGRDFYFANEYPAVRFLEKNGYDVSYIAGVDSDRSPQLLTRHKTFLSVGHDEYWSGAQRAHVEAARDAGVNLMFLSGNEVYWRTRYEPSLDASHQSYRTLVSYKETWSNDKIDPSPEWTGTWRDPRYAPVSQGANTPENSLTGQQYMVNFSDLAMKVTAAEGKLRMWRNTSVASLPAGQTATLAPHTIGYESDEDVDNGHRPAGLIRQSTTTGAVPEYLQDFGNTVIPGTTTHHMTAYRAASGALVFDAGTIQWSWGLDTVHDSPYAAEPADVRMQQAQVNLLADMSAQPTTLSTGLVAATKSSDTVGPTTTISTPAAGAAVGNGTAVSLQGTAVDSGGGIVAGVEVSTDAGVTWHAATGTTSWTYTYVQHGVGPTEVRVRAMDDTANIGSTATRSFAVSCPCSVFGAETPVAPASPAVTDAGAAELGMRFTPVADGFVSGVRFYKGTGNGGTHTGSLWDSAGQRLATATFGGESATGWQSVTFATPVTVAAGQTYVVSYTAPQGHYATQPWGFSAAGRDAQPLSVAGGFGADPAGVYAASGQFPTAEYQNSNYFVDVLFTTSDASPLIALDRAPLPDSTSVPASTTISARYSKPVVAGSVGVSVKDALGATVAGSTAYDAATRVVTFTPAAPLAGFVKYDVTLTGTDTQGNAITTGKNWSFTTAKPPSQPGVCPCTLFDDTTLPTVPEAAETDPVTLGVRFSPEITGNITGVRFYKSGRNTGPHTGALWTADGTQLASGTFVNESSAGWQTLVFDTPVKVTANVEYLASYRTTAGRYSLTPNQFATTNLSRSPLRVSSDSGAYTYGTGAPLTRSATNYLVDPVFDRLNPVISMTAQDPAPGALDVAPSSPIKVWFSTAIQAGASLTAAVGGNPVAGTQSLGSGGTVLTLAPSAALPLDTLVDVTLSGVKSTEGAALATQSWSFRTSPGAVTQQPQTLFGSDTPQVEAADESAPVELGVGFTPSKDGVITHVRFFKGAGNVGSHTGSIWSASGQQLATVAFTGETPTGWQSAKLATPLRVSAGTTYVVSYLAPQGHYSYTDGFFSGPWTSGNLTAPAANNGRYLYGAAGGFPTYTWDAANYFVDVAFQPDDPVISVADRHPTSGATDVPRSTSVSLTASAPIRPGATVSVTSGGSAVTGTTALSGDGTTLTFSPSAALPADADVQVATSGVVSVEGAALADQSWTFHTEPAEAPTANFSLFSGVTPATTSAADNGPLEVGAAFTPSRAGSVTAIRFYKGAGNTGTHVGSLWNANGDRIATVTFSGETASGWQTASLATPVDLVAGQTYVVSYFAPNGHYAVSQDFFGSTWTAGPLSAAAGSNGLYGYSAGGGFPTSSYRASNYFVDVVFRSTAS